ncbi:MAG: polyprenyl synthetase family protein [Candidatus Marinimicrobia bacterium]|nr:polyprenyl synthetase family protein [Candidatus Neomarinimicrobiota bacterium]
MISSSTFESYYPDYTQWFNTKISQCIDTSTPGSLYEPIAYVMRNSGKQIRPAILSAVARSMGNVEKERSFPAAACVEMIHNFTLIHDDIMDGDELRHGNLTVHKKWDANKAILSGDGLFSIALKQLDAYAGEPALYSRMIPLLLGAVIRVCEGQAMDMDFETRENVLLDEYLDMVTQKTSCLLAVSGRLGAMLAGASDEHEILIENILLELGVVFQMQDDLLELTSDESKMGKTLGSDLIKQKKTYPYLYAKQELPEPLWQSFIEMTREATILNHGVEPARTLLRENFIFDRIHEDIKLRHDTIHVMIKELPAGVQDMLYSIAYFILHREK